MKDKCPYCGEPYMESVRKYGCDFLVSTPIRSRGCYARQISAIQASRDRWKELTLACLRDSYHNIPEFHKAVAALKQAGEWED